MGMTADHVDYLAGRTLAALKQRIKDEWGVVVSSSQDEIQILDTAWGDLSIAPCPFGFLAECVDQERLTGDSADREYRERVSDENWERMKQALASLR